MSSACPDDRAGTSPDSRTIRTGARIYLWKDGEIVLDHAARCPKTLDALAKAPVAVREEPLAVGPVLAAAPGGPDSAAHGPHQHAPHLPPAADRAAGCALRVGNDTRVPVEGKAWVFDDTIEHEAWNRSDRARVILLFEIWRPELTEEERALVAAMFEAIDAYSGEKPAWSI